MSDGQFSTKPIWSAKRTDITSTAMTGAGDFGAVDARDFAQAPSVQREIQRLMQAPGTDIGHIDCAPFPRNIPDAALDLGKPIASAILVQEYLIGLVFLRFWGWVFLPFGALICLAAAGTLISGLLDFDNHDAVDTILGGGVAFAFGIGIIGAGAWFGIFRGRVINERCWFCKHGMVWMTEKEFEWYPWEDVPEVYSRLAAVRPALGIRFDGPISWISFSDMQASRTVVHLVETQASAAWLTPALKLLAEGKSIRFGDWRLHRLTLESPDRQSLPWTRVADIRSRGGELSLTGNDGRAEMAVWLDDVPLPSLFTALVRALVAHTREKA